MSDMSHVYKAYAAVHNSEKRNDLSEVRDQISEMNLKQLTDVDLYEVAEEVLEDVFAGGADIADAKKLIESVFTKASEGDANPFREDKIDRLAEAFISAFEKVTERSLRTAVESYSEYRINKERLEKWNDSNSTGNVNAKLHEKLVAQDRLIVKNGLKSMIESVGSAVDKTLSAVGDVAKVGAKAAVGTAKGAAGAVKIAGKVVKGVGSAAGRIAGTPVGVAKSIKKGFKSGSSTNESYGNPASKEEKLRKDDKLFGSPNKMRKNVKTGKLEIPKEAYTVTRADIKGNTPAAQGLKAGKKNVKTGEPLYKAADHLTKEELETSGKFTTEEITKILWSDFIEGYQRDPEKGEAEERKKKRERKGGYDEKRERRMNDPKTGINSPAFAEFMRSRGM